MGDQEKKKEVIWVGSQFLGISKQGCEMWDNKSQEKNGKSHITNNTSQITGYDSSRIDLRVQLNMDITSRTS